MEVVAIASLWSELVHRPLACSVQRERERDRRGRRQKKREDGRDVADSWSLLIFIIFLANWITKFTPRRIKTTLEQVRGVICPIR